MKAVGQAGMLAAILLVPGCGEEPESTSADPREPLRRATFRSLVTRDFLVSCPGGAAAHAATTLQIRRFEELKQLAVRKEAGQAIWLGENDWAGVARYSDREPCQPGEKPYREALAAFSGSLDVLAARVADYVE